MKRFLPLAIVSLLAISHPSRAGAAIVIDAFSDSFMADARSTSPTQTQSASNLQGVVGGSRTVTITETSTTGAGSGAYAATDSGISYLVFNTPANSTATLTLDYGTNLNLNLVGLSAFDLPLFGEDFSSAGSSNREQYAITIVSGADTPATATATSSVVWSNANGTHAGDQLLPLAGFTGVNLADVDRITLKLSVLNGTSPDIAAYPFTVVGVPEPTTAVTVAIAGSALLARRRQTAR